VRRAGVGLNVYRRSGVYIPMVQPQLTVDNIMETPYNSDELVTLVDIAAIPWVYKTVTSMSEEEKRGKTFLEMVAAIVLEIEKAA